MIPQDKRSFAAFGHDLVAAIAAWFVAYWLRFNFDIPEFFVRSMFESWPWVVAVQALVFLMVGLYRGIWRYASMADLYRIVLAAGLSAMAIAMVMVFIQVPNVPRSVLLIDPLLLVVAMGGSRFAYRGWRERRSIAPGIHPILIIGAGDAAADLLKSLARSKEWRVVGLLDDNPGKHRRQIQGVPVLGPLISLFDHAKNLSVRHAIIAMPGVEHTARRRAMNL